MRASYSNSLKEALFETSDETRRRMWNRVLARSRLGLLWAKVLRHDARCRQTMGAARRGCASRAALRRGVDVRWPAHGRGELDAVDFRAAPARLAASELA